MSEAKPFSISKRLVWEAYKRVKANDGAAGVDEQTIKEFEGNLANNLFQTLEPDVVRQLPSAAGAPCRHTER